MREAERWLVSGVAPPETMVALAFLRRTGVQFLEVRRRELDCGCTCRFGYRTDNYEVAAGIKPCDDHGLHVAWVLEHAHDAGVMAEVGEMPLSDSLVFLLERKIREVPA